MHCKEIKFFTNCRYCCTVRSWMHEGQQKFRKPSSLQSIWYSSPRIIEWLIYVWVYIYSPNDKFSIRKEGVLVLIKTAVQ